MARVLQTSIYTCCLVVASTLFSAHAAPPATQADLAAVDKAALQRDLAGLGATITSQRSLSRHLSAGVTQSPLGRLSQPALRRFLASLQFNESGLTTFRYTELEAELTPTQIYQVLALFGQQHQTPKLKHARRVTPLGTNSWAAVSRACSRPTSSAISIRFPPSTRRPSAEAIIITGARVPGPAHLPKSRFAPTTASLRTWRGELRRAIWRAGMPWRVQ